MSIKISFMHYMKRTRVMLLDAFEEFELVCILLLFFSFHYHCQLVKGQLQQKSGGLQPSPPPPSSHGFYGPGLLYGSQNSECLHSQISVFKLKATSSSTKIELAVSLYKEAQRKHKSWRKSLGKETQIMGSTISWN